MDDPATGALREAVLRLAPLPEQERFGGRTDQTLPAAEQDPARHPYAVVEDVPVGFFVLDETPSEADPSADLVLRSFFVDAAQGRGVARRAVALLPGPVRDRHPAAGFVDGGALYLGGNAGPQHVLRLDLPVGGERPAPVRRAVPT